MKQLLFTILSILIFPVFGMTQVCPGTPGQVTWEYYEGPADDQMGELKTLSKFPQNPDLKQIKYKLQSPVNFNNYMGSRMTGFIYVPEATTAIFNITGDDVGEFYLSTDSDPANKQLIAYFDDNTGISEHDNQPSQTSMSINLQPGVDYYFELLQVEESGGDHVSVYWKTDLVDPDVWNIVTFQFLKDIGCVENTCPNLGTPCDDGDASTVDDMEDGYCHCLGISSTSDVCIGERGKVIAYRYDDISGGNLNDLYTHPNYPAMPNTSRQLSELGYSRESNLNNFGELLQGYIQVPETGSYTFALTGDDRTIFNLSSDSDPANVNSMELYVNGSTNPTEFDKYSTQIGQPVTLQAGDFYYYELKHKESGGAEHFSVFWKSPFTDVDQWKRIPSIFLYDYTCTLACIPESTLCDDGNIFTNNDMYNSTCECVGVPCSGPDCDSPLANYVPFDKCGLTGEIGNSSDDSWLSCEISLNPIPDFGENHWIQYDLGERHFLFGSHVWNYNVMDSTQYGFTDVSIDYSLDGNTWTHLGDYAWSLATGEVGYAGFMGPDFMGAEARFVLISSLTKEDCKGLSKIAFTAVKCPFEGTICDDENENTFDDRYNNNCECHGKDFLENDCAEPMVILGDSILTQNKYSAIETVTSISEVDGNTKVSFIGGDYVILDVGFVTHGEAVFIASIDTCETTGGRFVDNSLLSQIREEMLQREEDKIKKFQVLPVEDSDDVLVKYYLEKATSAELHIYNANQQSIYCLSDHDYTNKAVYQKLFKKDKLPSGVYTVKIISDQLAAEELLIVEK